jgi:hypothetical protein
MNKKILDLLATSAFLLIDRESLIPFYEEAGGKLTTDEDSHLRFDFDGGYSLIVKHDKDNAIQAVNQFHPNGDKTYHPKDEIIKIRIEHYQSGLEALKTFPRVTSSETAILICDDDLYLSHIEKDTKAGFISDIATEFIVLKIIKEEVSDLQILINDCLPGLNEHQLKAINKIVQDKVFEETRRCHRVIQAASMSLLDEK